MSFPPITDYFCTRTVCRSRVFTKRSVCADHMCLSLEACADHMCLPQALMVEKEEDIYKLSSYFTHPRQLLEDSSSENGDKVSGERTVLR